MARVRGCGGVKTVEVATDAGKIYMGGSALTSYRQLLGHQSGRPVRLSYREIRRTDPDASVMGARGRQSLGLGGTVTAGIVSARGRNIGAA